MTGGIKGVTGGNRADELSDGGTIASSFPRALLRFAVERGVDRTALLEHSGFDPAASRGPDDHAPLGVYSRMMRAAVELSGDPAFPLKFGREMPMDELTIVGLIAGSVRTVREGLDQMNRYARLVIDEDSGLSAVDMLDLVVCGDEIWAQFTSKAYEAELDLTAAAFARSLNGVTVIAGRSPFPHEIHFVHPEPAHRAAFEDVFRTKIVFGSKWNAFRIDEAFLDAEMPKEMRRANDYVFGVLSERAEELMRDLEANETIRGRVQKALMAELHTGKASIEQIAAQLGMSRQTLYRRLKAEGETFESLLDDLRRDVAIRYLEGGKVSISEAAYLVGFSEQSAFSRAFKRWTGRSPSAYRR